MSKMVTAHFDIFLYKNKLQIISIYIQKFKNDLKEELEIRKKLKLAVTSYYKKAYSDNPDYNVVRESYFSVINFFFSQPINLHTMFKFFFTL